MVDTLTPPFSQPLFHLSHLYCAQINQNRQARDAETKGKQAKMAERSAGTSTASKLYTVELGQHRCISILRECMGQKDKDGNSLIEDDAELGCCLYKGKTTSDGHWQIQRRPRYLTRESKRAEGSSNAHRAYYVHRIAYVALHGRDIEATGSHLCGRANCFNPYHIVDESQFKNNDRQRCLGFVICPQHNHVLVKLCTHNPPCIKSPIKAMQCCLTATQEIRVVPDSQESTLSSSPAPVPVITLPPVRRIQDFLQTQPNLPEDDLEDSQFVGTSQESATDLITSGESQNLPAQGESQSSGAASSQDIMQLDLPSSSQGPDFTG